MPVSQLLNKKENGSYATAGLNSQQFQKAFNTISKENAERRRKANRTVTPAMLKRKSTADLAKAGKNSKGAKITRADLLELERNKKQFERKYDKSRAGITFAEIVSGSRDIDIKRANNKVTDGSGITRSNLIQIKTNNTFVFRVKASEKHGMDDHRVFIRLEEWDDFLHNAEPDKKGYDKAVKLAAKGRMSLQCSCNRFRFWYRYLGTIGNYCVSPPKEFSPPKVRNPNFSGVACKHILHTVNKLQAPIWQVQLAKQMAKQANKIGYGDDKRSSYMFTKDELKAQNKTRKGGIDKAKADKEYARYVKRQNAFAKRHKEKTVEAPALKRRNAKLKKENDALQEKLKLQELAAKQQAQQMGDQVRYFYKAFKDQNQGMSEKATRTAYVEQFGGNITDVNRILDAK